MFALKKVSNLTDYGFPNCYSYTQRQYNISDSNNPTDIDYLDKKSGEINEEIYKEIMVCIHQLNGKRKSRKKKSPKTSKKKTRRRKV